LIKQQCALSGRKELGMPLLKTTIQIKAHNSAIQNGLTFENLTSYRDSAEDKHIIPLIGRAFYNILNARILDQGANPLTIEESELVRLLTKASANLTIAYYTSFGSVQLSNAGAHVTVSESQRIASDKKIAELKNASFLNGFDALYQALQYLHEHKTTIPFTTYFADNAYTKNSFLFLQYPQEAIYINSLTQNPWLFDKLKGAQLRVIDTYLISLLGEALFLELQLKRKLQNLSPLQDELTKKIQKAVSFLTMAEGIVQNQLYVDANGIFSPSESTGGITGNFQMRDSPMLRDLNSYMHTFLSRGEAELENIRIFLNAKATTLIFPEYVKQNPAALAPTNLNSGEAPFFLT